MWTVNVLELNAKNKYLDHFLKGKSLQNTFMGEYLKNNNAKKVIFIFSPKCKHCVEQAKALSFSKESIIGFYPNFFSNKDIQIFRNETILNFELYPVKNDSINKYIKSYPMIFIVKNGIVESIVQEYSE